MSRKLQNFVGTYLLSANPICTRTCFLHWHRCCAELDRSEKRYRQNHGERDLETKVQRVDHVSNCSLAYGPTEGSSHSPTHDPSEPSKRQQRCE